MLQLSGGNIAADLRHSGIVDQDIDAAQAGIDCLNQSGHLIGLGEGGWLRKGDGRVSAEIGQPLKNPVGGRRDCHLCATRQQQTRRRKANPVRAAGTSN